MPSAGPSAGPATVWKSAPRQSTIGSVGPRQSVAGGAAYSTGARSSMYMRRKSLINSQADETGVSLSTQLQNIRSSNQQIALENMLLEAALHRLTPAGGVGRTITAVGVLTAGGR